MIFRQYKKCIGHKNEDQTKVQDCCIVKLKPHPEKMYVIFNILPLNTSSRFRDVVSRVILKYLPLFMCHERQTLKTKQTKRIPSSSKLDSEFVLGIALQEL